jgi:uncharacterized protein YhaN
MTGPTVTAARWLTRAQRRAEWRSKLHAAEAQRAKLEGLREWQRELLARLRALAPLAQAVESGGADDRTVLRFRGETQRLQAEAEALGIQLARLEAGQEVA